jgi:hypothetical protein
MNRDQDAGKGSALCFGDAAFAVLLEASGFQAGKAASLECALPNEKLLFGQLIPAHGFFHCDLAAPDGSQHFSFATGCPSYCWG